MNKDRLDEINRQRLASWREKLNNDHATPMLLIGTGHDHVSGKIVIITLEDISDQVIIKSLEFALKELRGY